MDPRIKIGPDEVARLCSISYEELLTQKVPVELVRFRFLVLKISVRFEVWVPTMSHKQLLTPKLPVNHFRFRCLVPIMDVGPDKVDRLRLWVQKSLMNRSWYPDWRVQTRWMGFSWVITTPVFNPKLPVRLSMFRFLVLRMDVGPDKADVLSGFLRFGSSHSLLSRS